MRILSLEVEQYGVFSQREFDFGSGRFQLICGPNEAGKSTLLQLIRESLFGFPHQSPYRFNEIGEMASTVRMVMANGKELRFRRRKGTKDAVVGKWSDDGAAIDEEQLHGLLGASPTLFQSVFAFSLAELASGQKSLEQAQLTEALFGGAIGGLAKFQSLNKRIHDDASQLFTQRSSKRKLNLLLGRIDQLQEQLENVASRPDDYQQLVKQHADYQAQIEKLTQRRSRVRDVRHEAQRMCDAWPSFVKLQALKRQQTGGGKLKLTAEQWLKAEQLRDQRQRLAERIREQQAIIKRREPQQTHLKSKASDNILAQESQVQAMVQEMSRMQDFAEQLPLRQRDLEEATARFRERLRNLDLHWDLHRLEQIPDDRQLHQRLLREARGLNEKRRLLDEVRRVERQHRLQLRDVQSELAVGSGEPVTESATDSMNDWDAWDEWDGAWDESPVGGNEEAEAPQVKAESQTPSAHTSDGPDVVTTRRPGGDPTDVKRRPFDALDSMDPLEVDPVDAPESMGDIWEPLDDISLEENESFAGPDQGTVLSEPQVAEFDRLIDRESSDRAERLEMDAIDKRRRDKQEARRNLQARMSQWGDWRIETAPQHETEVVSSRQAGQELQHRLTSATRRVEEVQQTLKDHQQQATQFQHAPPDDEQLRALRLRRDEAWTLIRRHFVEQASQESAIRERYDCDPSQLASKLPQLIEAADMAADVRQDQASVVAQMKNLRTAIQKHEQQLANARLQQQTARQALEDHQRQWAEFWPGGPAWDDVNALSWLKCRDELAEMTREVAELDLQRQTHAASTAAYERELREALNASDSDLDTLRVELRERMRRHQIWEARREHLELRSQELSCQLDEAVKDEARIANGVRQSELTWEDLRQRMQLPDGWGADTIASNMSEINAAKADGKHIRELERLIDSMRTEIESFRNRVERIAGESDEERSAVETLHKLSQRLETAQQSKQQLSAQQAEDQRLATDLLHLQQEASEANQQWESLRKLSGAGSDEAFINGLKGASMHQQLESARDQVFVALACDDRDRRQLLMSELEKSSQAELQRRLGEAKQLETQLDEELNQLHKEHGASQNRLQQVDSSDLAAAVEMDRQSALAELAEVVDQWAPLKLAAKLMEQALERFERNHQPALLEEVGRLFRKMTDNGYVEIRRQLDKQGTLQAVDSSGNAKTPDQLSTGAREQLYLAIRLAYVKQYCQTAEPLPLVLDDVLVNFDEARAKRTIDTLVEMSDDVQILMLTCHKQTARLIYQQCSGMQPILLSNDSAETLESWIKPSAGRSRRRRPSSPDSPQQGVLFPKG